jgi:DNA invertase Pin-like site-specific DNA recombinase
MTKRVAFYLRVSTDRNQTTENQLRVLQEVAARLDWNVVAQFSDEGISGAKGRDQRPGFDALLKGVARREFDLIATWSVDRLGRSLQHLVGFLGDIQARGVDLYLHQQALDTSTPSGKMLFQMLGVFSEFERAMIAARVKAGLARTTKRLGRPPVDAERRQSVIAMLAAGNGVREVARQSGLSATSVSRIRQSVLAT